MSKFYDHFWKSKDYKKLGDFKFKLPIIKKYIPQKSNLRILDYGCGAGIVLEIMSEINPKCFYIGVDISQEIIKLDKKRLPQFKFLKINEEKKLPFKDNFFDFVISTDVIEHIYNTPFLFGELSRILKPGGKILLTTPYHGFFKNLAIILTNNFELIFDPLKAHIRFFTKKSMTYCLKKVDLIPQKYEYYGRFYPLSNGMLVLAKKPEK